MCISWFSRINPCRILTSLLLHNLQGVEHGARPGGLLGLSKTGQQATWVNFVFKGKTVRHRYGKTEGTDREPGSLTGPENVLKIRGHFRVTWKRVGNQAVPKSSTCSGTRPSTRIDRSFYTNRPVPCNLVVMASSFLSARTRSGASPKSCAVIVRSNISDLVSSPSDPGESMSNPVELLESGAGGQAMGRNSVAKWLGRLLRVGGGGGKKRVGSRHTGKRSSRVRDKIARVEASLSYLDSLREDRSVLVFDWDNCASPLEIARHPILKVTCKHFALPWSHC